MVVRLCIAVSPRLHFIGSIRNGSAGMSYVNVAVLGLPVDALLIISVNRSNSFEEVMVSG